MKPEQHERAILLVELMRAVLMRFAPTAVKAEMRRQREDARRAEERMMEGSE